MAKDGDDIRVEMTDEELVARFNPATDAEPKRGPGRPPKPKFDEAAVSEAAVWTQAMCAAIIAKQILSAADVAKAAPIADAVLTAYKERFK